MKVTLKSLVKSEITAFSGVFVVINQFIGSGIFITQSGILNCAGLFGVSLLCGEFGGKVALAGVMCYLELWLLVRKTGGEYAILLEAYSLWRKNRWVEILGSLVYTWTNVLLLRGVSVSIITMTCTRYLTSPFLIQFGCEVPKAGVKLIALAILCKLTTMLNLWGISSSTIVCSKIVLDWKWACRSGFGKGTMPIFKRNGTLQKSVIALCIGIDRYNLHSLKSINHPTIIAFWCNEIDPCHSSV